MSDKNETEATNIQLYGLNSIALVFAIIAFIISIIAELNSAALKDLTQNNSITVINSANGFSGSVANHVATLSTTVNGLLSGQKGGKIDKATNKEIVATTMQGFVANLHSTETSNITSSNTILEAIEKGCVLTQTKLGPDFETQSGTLTPNDTLNSFFEQGQYLLNTRKTFFSAFGKGFVNSTRELWEVPPTFGTSILPSGFWKLGTSISITSWYSDIFCIYQ